MKIRVFGDIHGRSNWKNFINNLNEDLYIFLGDYVDSYDISDQEIIDNLLDIIKFKETYKDKVILLYGNHEFNYNSFYLNYCSGYRSSYSYIIKEILEKNKDLFSIIHLIEFPLFNMIFSHAGLTKSWIEYNDYWLNAIDLNNYIYSEPLDITINSSIDSYRILDRVISISGLRGGSSFYGGPLWADMLESKDDYLKIYNSKPLIQFVGHTPQRDGTVKIKKNKLLKSSITYCDISGNEDIVIDINKDLEVKIIYSDLKNSKKENFVFKK